MEPKYVTHPIFKRNELDGKKAALCSEGTARVCTLHAGKAQADGSYVLEAMYTTVSQTPTAGGRVPFSMAQETLGQETVSKIVAVEAGTSLAEYGCSFAAALDEKSSCLINTDWRQLPTGGKP